MEDNNIFIGGKPFMNYVTGVVMQFTTKNAEDVIVKARGKFISRAVDVAEVASKRFLEGTVEVRNIKSIQKAEQNVLNNKGQVRFVVRVVAMISARYDRNREPSPRQK